jgi:hypothetical protein
MISHVECRLAATGLSLGISNLETKPSKNPDGANGDLREKLVDQAGNK